jgi:hypothetical protein
MILSEACRAKAKECEQRARATLDPEFKRQLQNARPRLAKAGRADRAKSSVFLGPSAAMLHRQARADSGKPAGAVCVVGLCQDAAGVQNGSADSLGGADEVIE